MIKMFSKLGRRGDGRQRVNCGNKLQATLHELFGDRHARAAVADGNDGVVNARVAQRFDLLESAADRQIVDCLAVLGWIGVKERDRTQVVALAQNVVYQAAESPCAIDRYQSHRIVSLSRLSAGSALQILLIAAAGVISGAWFGIVGELIAIRCSSELQGGTRCFAAC